MLSCNSENKSKLDIKDIIDDIHLYDNKIELLIRYVLWGILWIGGIVVVKDTPDKRTLTSSFFIFGLSMLMELGPKIKGKKYYISRFIYLVLVLAMVLIVLMSVRSLMGMVQFETYYTFMYYCSSILMIYLAVDFFIAWLEPGELHKIRLKDESDKTKEENEICERDVFCQRLISGNLGNIGKGDTDDE